jgi:hypothetical protein
MLKRLAIAFFTFSASLAVPGGFAAPIVFSEGGDNTTASIQAEVDAFRAALGEPNNGNAPGPLAGGRREINWDGGGNNDTTTPPATPFVAFLDSRGARFTTPGTGLSQAPPSGGLEGGVAGPLVGNNPTYATTFGTFSPLRLFVPVGSNITDGTFFLPGTAGGVPATVSGFGAVFTDVDLADTTRIEFFDAGEAVRRVRITTGTDPLGPNDDPAQGVDVVAMDDFFYGEPSILRVVDEPSLPGLLAVVGLVLLLASRRRARRPQP